MSLRVKGPPGDGQTTRDYRGGSDDPYMSRLVKLVPAEAISIYPVIMTEATRMTPADGSPRWERIAVAGQSQGGGHAAFIAKARPVARVVMLSGGWDMSARGEIADWYYQHHYDDAVRFRPSTKAGRA